jgi:hypothetical protein
MYVRARAEHAAKSSWLSPGEPVLPQVVNLYVPKSTSAQVKGIGV